MTEIPKQAPRTPRTGDVIYPAPRRGEEDVVQTKRRKLPPPKPVRKLAYVFVVIMAIASFAPIFMSDMVWSSYDEVERSPYQSMQSWTDVLDMDVIRREDPITLASYFLEQLSPFSDAITHHAINLLLHITAALLLLKTLEKLKLYSAFGASLIFAMHPSVLQTVFWAGYRTEIISLIFLLITLFFGIRNRGITDFFLTIGFSIIAFVLHPAALVIPLVLALCVLYQNPRFELKNFNRILPLFVLALFAGVWSLLHQTGADLGFSDHVGIAAQNLYFYLRQALLPFDVGLFHPFESSQSYKVGTQNSLLPFLLFIPFYVLIGLFIKKNWAKGALMGISSYILLSIYGLSQKGIFIDGSPAHEDHLHYISLPIIIALVVCTSSAVALNLSSAIKKLWNVGFLVFSIAIFSTTFSFALNVSDPIKMWQQVSKQWPESWQPKLALLNKIQESPESSELMDRVQTIKILNDILEKQPDRVTERILLARIYRSIGQKSNALREYQRVLRVSEPGDEFLIEAANLLDELGKSWEARNARERISKK